MNIKKKISVVIILVIIIININHKVEANMISKENMINTLLYRNSTKEGFAIKNDNSLDRILKLVSDNDKQETYYFTNDSMALKKDYRISCNLKTNFQEAWKDYNKYCNLDKNNSFLNTNKYNQLMWIFDNAYISSYDKENNITKVNEYINNLNERYNAGINNYNSRTGENNLLNEDDIEIVQQLAIWHYTATGTRNDIGDPRQSDYKIGNLAITKDNISGKYKMMYDENAYREKLIAMSKLYTCLVLNANENYQSINLAKLKNNEIQLANFFSNDSTTVNTVRSNEQYSYVTGPYFLSDNGSGVNYKISSFMCEAEFTNGEGRDITNEITILTQNANGRYDTIVDANGNVITDNLQILEKLKKENTPFYLAVSSSVSKLKKINLIVNSRYTVREVFYYSLNNPGENDAPILKIEDVQEVQEYTTSAILELTTEIDFSLRQFISAINGQEIKNGDGNYTREPIVDLSYINKKIDGRRITTAEYNQTKDTIKVNVGDIITYTIRVYNEGGIDGYVSEITDYLPPYLEFINDEENSSNGWIIQDANNLRVVKTRKLEKINGDDIGNESQRLIKAFDGNKLCYKDVKLKCKVINPNIVDSITATLNNIEETAQNEENVENEENVAIQNEEYYEDDGGTGGIAYIIQYAKDIINGNNHDNENNTITEHVVNEEIISVVENTQEEVNNNIINNENENENENPENNTDESDKKSEIVIITNLAEITEIENKSGSSQNVFDRDSQVRNFILPTDEELPTYRNSELEKNNKYVLGQQDDDDFEKVQLKNFDLALRSFISKINEEDITSRIPKVDMSNLNNATNSTASYNHSKEAFKAQIGDTITITIRVYNEGEVDGYCEEIMHHIPPQLQFVDDNDINRKYEWERLNGNLIKTSYLSKNNDEKGSGENKRENKIGASDGSNLNYKDVQIVLKVVRTEQMLKKITTFSEISEFKDFYGNEIKDRDSIKLNFVEPEIGAIYQDEQIKNAYVPGQEDDDDFEKIIIGEFDLAIQEFVSKVNDTNISNRIPQVDGTNLKNITSTNAAYNYSSDILTVNAGDIVEYTIRVYNEGDIAGYASEIIDEISEGLEFIPDNEINKEYKWKMYDKDGNQTEEISNAVTLKTNYLSKEAGEERMANNSKVKKNPSLISAFDVLADISDINPECKDIKIAFKVKTQGISGEIIKNEVQISKINNENGNAAIDRDSKENEWNENEDDQYTENLRVRYFNLIIKEQLEEAKIINNGTMKIIKNNNPSSNINFEISKDKIESAIVKFKYKIIIKNAGTIPGYVKEIKDYIPEGLEYYENDNVQHWEKLEDNVWVTNHMQDIVIEPGKTIESEITLSWDGKNQQLTSYNNYVEISKDYNEFNTADIDSIPDNGINEENDISKMTITLEKKTTNIKIYIVIIGSAIFLIVAITIIIKKFIL